MCTVKSSSYSNKSYSNIVEFKRTLPSLAAGSAVRVTSAKEKRHSANLDSLGLSARNGDSLSS